jgi:hypothetical protein
MIKILRVVGDVAVVTATAEFHPLRQLKRLTLELEVLNFEGMVLFDLLAVNGLSDNRFASMKFRRGDFERSSFAVESDVNSNIRSEQDFFAREDEEFLLGSVLSSDERYRFIH